MKRLNLCLLLILLMAFCLAGTARAGAVCTFEAMGGSAISFPTPLAIYQEGQPVIFIDSAHYETNPFKESPYYSWRVAKWENGKAWEFELVHHKLYLETAHDDIQHFEITHGYNLITVNRAWKKDGLIYHLGGGIVLAHPETTIRNKSLPEVWKAFDMGFYVSGVTAQFALGKRFELPGKLFAVVEGKLTGSYARIPVKEGYADVPNAAVHGLFGIGYEF